MYYPVKITPDGDNFMVSFPDIPEALTCGETVEDAKQEAVAALITAFDFYFEDERPVPMPSHHLELDLVEVPLSVWAKVLTLNTMLETKTSQIELARRMGTRKQEIQRIVNLHHNTKIDTLNSAMMAMGKHLSISVG
ncbi:MAG: type II toxin-antitoxin system HicB family antitoxin [Vibrio sp.]